MIALKALAFWDRWHGWRLLALFSVGAVIAVEAIVAGMEMWLLGVVTWDYLVTGLAAVGVVAPTTYALLTYLLDTMGSLQAHNDRLQQLQVTLEAEQALSRSRSLLQTIVDSAPIRIFWKDVQGRYLGCNPLFAQDAGLASALDVVGKTDDELVWAAQAEAYRAADQRVMQSGCAELGFEEPQSGANGQTRWLRTSKVPLSDGRGQVIGVLGLYEDITASKAEQERLRLAALAVGSAGAAPQQRGLDGDRR